MDFEAFILTHEPAIRLGAFAAVFAAVAVWEVIAPRRTLAIPRAQRWSGNLALLVLNTVLLRLVFPLAAVGMAAFGAGHGWGALNHFQVPAWLALPLAVIALDFVIWMQHVMMHAVPALWRLHRVHHADLDYDLTTGTRFHPLEMVLSMGVKFAAIAVLGPPVLAVIIFEVLLNATAMFNHGNVRLGPAAERWLRRLVVTPDMHRVHHSVRVEETHSNFGFNLPWWDLLFGTYRAQPRDGHAAMAIGIREHRDPQEVNRLPGMLWLPLRGSARGHATDRREWHEAQATRH
jgi:sterol desaturase/sphingolipid hydroxylase (fatty acid hydroxylase superfamily)